ncbi:Protein UGX2 [Sugiyamaella lignohabitans]|uniref:Protein UGX2 n=1 Tax=Sugiyamaella lignohabitans TaxID=796027 RepID=A0A167CE80_9ASCO|nr:Protein UGX2 [Sugiyamaella lignohabitans]ANB11576.1 Protein UGX2 [Sugiyamaella lignohabitans]
MMCSTPPKKHKLSSGILSQHYDEAFSSLSPSSTSSSMDVDGPKTHQYPHYGLRSSSGQASGSVNAMNIGTGISSASAASPSSTHSQSWRVRRSSFLSEKMMHEDHNSYEVGIAEDGSTRYNLSVKESQGFQWNPDLFVSKYHQSEFYRYSSSSGYSHIGTSSSASTSAGSSSTDPFNDRSRPAVQDIVIDAEEDIFPSDY